MKYLSVCSGIEAATSAWHHLGWEPVAFSEIEPFPSAVLKHHYPNVPNWGDMTQYKTWPDATIDLLVGGTPCQSFSIAGLRKGLEDPRGNLMLTFLGIAQRYRPKYIVWENVPGVLSSNGGRDFGTFLAALGELGYGWAYRVLDAQWFGVAQRRRRVFVVGCLGDQRRAAQVLFECESVRRDTPPSRAKGQGAAADAQGSVGGGSWWDGGDTSATLTRKNAGGEQRMPDKDNFGAVLQPHAFKVRGGCEGGGSWWDGGDVHPTLNQSSKTSGGPGFSNQELFSQNGGGLVPHAFKVRGGCEGGGEGYLGSDDTAFTVATHQDQQIAQPLPFDTTQVTSPANYSSPKPGDPCHPLAAGAHIPAVAFAQNTRDEVRLQNGDGQIAGALAAEPGMKQTTYVAQPVAFSDVGATLKGGSGERGHPDPSDGNGHNIVAQPVAPALTASNDPSRSPQSSEVTQQVTAVHQAAMQVRRLTPVECERLQGFRDNHTNIPWRGKAEAPDGPRYKALGNSMAVPVMRWIGERINACSPKTWHR